MPKSIHDGLEFPPKIDRLVLLVIFTIFSILVLPQLFVERLWPDEALYLWYAKNITGSFAFSFSAQAVEFHPPLFPTLIAIFGKLFHVHEQMSAQFLSWGWALGALIAIGGLGSRFGGPAAGSVACILLCFNPVFIKYANKIVPDVPQMVITICLVWAILKREEASESTPMTGMIWMITCTLILLKWSGLLALFFVGAANFYPAKEFSWKKSILRAMRDVSVPGFLSLILFFNNWRLWNSFFPPHWKTLAATSLWEKIFILNDSEILLGHPWLLFLAVLGLGFLWTKRQWYLFWLAFLWVIVFGIGTGFISPFMDLRYGLLVVPVFIILAAISINGGIALFLSARPQLVLPCQYILVILLLFSFLWKSSQYAAILAEDNKFFKGFSPAADCIHQYWTKETAVLATSSRQIRYATGIEFAAFGGTLVEFPWEKEELLRMIEQNPYPMIVELDNWGSGGLPRFDPGQLKDQGFMASEGFQLIQEIGWMIYKDEKGKSYRAPAMWIFYRGKAKN